MKLVIRIVYWQMDNMDFNSLEVAVEEDACFLLLD